MAHYYVDTCIWLNLFLKEGDESKCKPYWKIAQKFIDSERPIVVSTVILKELSIRIDQGIYNDYFRGNSNIQMISTEHSDYDVARELERDDTSRLSFHDYLHVAIAHRRGYILITRDKGLLRFASGIIDARKPEELIQ
jgi:predicted nucleic acid-binding protein